jgi:LysM repeat protein
MTYTVRAGDTLSKIAMRNGVTMAQLLQANPQVKDPNKIRVGDVINVPNEGTTEKEAQTSACSDSHSNIICRSGDWRHWKGDRGGIGKTFCEVRNWW